MNNRALWEQKYASNEACKQATKPRSKYGAERQTDGSDSQRESRRLSELRLMERAGLITDLQQHVRFEIIPGNSLFRPTYYEADSVYTIVATGERVVEDVKWGAPGTSAHNAYKRTAAYRVFKIKQKLMYQVHGIKISEV